MDGGAHGGGGNAGGGGGGPAPFLLKTYEMVDDAFTDGIVSWSSTNASFVVWNPPEFTARLLPTYFKHNNFSSFIRQLNTYGFRKIDPERWEFANDEFIKGQKCLLKNIHRRKPIHSHSHPPGGGLADAERAVLEEEIERLNREKTDLEANLWRFRQQLSGTENQMEDLERRLADMEQRQLKIVAFMQRAIHKPQLMENLLQMVGASPTDISVMHKKRRLPVDINYVQEASSMNSFHAGPCTSNKPHIGYALDKDFCNKLRLELNSAIPDDDLVTTGTQINEGNGDLQAEQTEFDHELIECLPLIPETSQLCDTGAPICATEEGVLVRGGINEGGRLFPSHLSLTLSWTTVQNDSKTSDLVNQVEANTVDLQTSATPRGNENLSVTTSQSVTTDTCDVNVVSPQDGLPPNDDAQGVNDMFWQQFLTERPGSWVVEEKVSLFTANSSVEHNEESRPGNGDI